MKNFIWLISLMKAAVFTIGMGIFLGCLSIGSNIGLMATAGWLITTAAFHPPLYELSVAIAGVRFFGIARACLRYGERYISHDATFQLLARIRTLFYEAIEKMPAGKLEKYCSGALLERMIGDIETLQYFFLRVAAPLVIALIIAIFVGSYVYTISSQLLFCFVATLVIGGGVLPFIIYSWQQRKAKPVNTLREALKTELTDMMAGSEERAAFQLGSSARKKTNCLCCNLGKEQESIAAVSAILEGLSTFILQFASCATLLILISLLEKGNITGIEAVVIFLVLTSSLESIAPLFMLPHFWQGSVAAAGRIQTMLAQRAETKKAGFAIKNYDLAFREVSVKYDKAELAALDGLSFNVPFGRKVAIVGASGAGKTTLAKALLSLVSYDGSIMLGGREIRSYSPELTREFISVVSQDTYLFSATIEENIRLARPAATKQELASALEAAGAKKFISHFEKKMETCVGQYGRSLSGGQRQRLALARAHLKNAPILILDEPTAGLDAVTAHAVMSSALQSTKQQTVLLITHWLCDLSVMDKIIVLERGKIVEQGTQEELLTKQGSFYRMQQIQRNMI
ncbi:MAG: thiol reductant ABC exporter subunit CydC [Pelosinus sp.]|nr:thiol reductant ABC exporter subunit CydC [Pelosinus sp.]